MEMSIDKCAGVALYVTRVDEDDVWYNYQSTWYRSSNIYYGTWYLVGTGRYGFYSYKYRYTLEAKHAQRYEVPTPIKALIDRVNT